MKTINVLVVGAVIGALDGVGIFFAPGERYKWEILFAAILKGILVSLITGYALVPRRSWQRGAGFGMLYGFGFALVVFLAKGGFKSMDAPYVVPAGIVMGLVTGLLVWKFGFRRLSST
ncbi:MAG: hypothetical protein ACJ8M4_09680 [Chthoniobacterales bacterium]